MDDGGQARAEADDFGDPRQVGARGVGRDGVDGAALHHHQGPRGGARDRSLHHGGGGRAHRRGAPREVQECSLGGVRPEEAPEEDWRREPDHDVQERDAGDRQAPREGDDPGVRAGARRRELRRLRHDLRRHASSAGRDHRDVGPRDVGPRVAARLCPRGRRLGLVQHGAPARDPNRGGHDGLPHQRGVLHRRRRHHHAQDRRGRGGHHHRLFAARPAGSDRRHLGRVDARLGGAGVPRAASPTQVALRRRVAPTHSLFAAATLARGHLKVHVLESS
mmetsp:Transcript_24942/g.80040  ORF Transcript_24942/g.80040 Transcript_24942/m.80040 type:complete len:277 (+) Transcript_24942:613-1443(+)